MNRGTGFFSACSGSIKGRAEQRQREGDGRGRTGRKLRGGTEGEKNTGNKNTTEELTKKKDPEQRTILSTEDERRGEEQGEN
jgi:hypothetical protein